MKLWRIQKFFGDVVYDLRNRRLLPVVILLLVAMVAVPVLIARGGSGSSDSSSQPTLASATPSPETENAVVSYSPPGIRNYKRRLNELAPKDPFRQQFSKSAAAASQLNSTVTTPAAAVGVGGSASTTGTGTTVSTGGSSGGHKPKHKKKKSKTTYTYDVTLYAGDASVTLTPFENVAPLTPLPSQDSSVVVFYGLSSDHTQALFLVSTKVDSLNGPGSCLPAPDDCALMALPAGASEDLHYSKDDKTYRIVVAQIKRTAK